MLVIIGGFVFWFGCSLLSFFLFLKKILFNNYFSFFILITLFYFILSYFILFYLLLSFSLFFLPFILSHVDDRPLVLQPGIRAVPLRWESQLQDTGPQETCRLQVISNGKSSPRDLHLNAKTQLQSMTSKLQSWTPYAKQLTRQEDNATH